MANEYKPIVVVCDECQGRNYSDPTREHHWPDCSRYTAWRFPKTRKRLISTLITGSFSGDGEGPCPHGFKHWGYCEACTYLADYDDGGEE